MVVDYVTIYIYIEREREIDRERERYRYIDTHLYLDVVSTIAFAKNDYRSSVCLCWNIFCLKKSQNSEGGMIRLETLIELRFLDSGFSSSNFSIRVFELVLLSKLNKQFSVERFEPTASQSSVPSPLLRSHHLA